MCDCRFFANPGDDVEAVLNQCDLDIAVSFSRLPFYEYFSVSDSTPGAAITAAELNGGEEPLAGSDGRIAKRALVEEMNVC